MSKAPEQEARETIDQMLGLAGWNVQDCRDANIEARFGVAIRNFPLKSGHGFADYILYVNQKASGVVEAQEGLVRFVTAFLAKSVSYGMGDYLGKVNWRISLKNIEDFVPVKEIELKVREIVSSDKYEKLTEQQKLAHRTFVDTVDGKIKGRFFED